MKEQKNAHKKGNWGVRSVYLVLAVCLVAVAAASWVTFRSISSTLQKSSDLSQTKLVEPTNETVSGVKETTESSALSSDEEEQADQPAAEPQTFQMPLGNGVTRPFSGTELVYSETLQDWRTHNGTDFAAEEGEEVQAVTGGTVTAIQDDGLMGTVVVVTSGETEWSYCGLARPVAVEQGETVTTGQVIGTVGELPAEQADQPHLHLEARQDGKLLDCETLLNSVSE